MIFIKRSIFIVLLFFNLLSSNDILKIPRDLVNLKNKIIQVDKFQPYCSKLLKDDCFLHSNIYILGYSKKYFLAYIIDNALDLEDDGEEYNFIIHNLNTDKKVVNIKYKYNFGGMLNEKEIIFEKIKNLNNKKYIDKKYIINNYNGFPFFWKNRKSMILKYLNRYNIKRSKENKNISYLVDKEINLRFSKMKSSNLFPNESFCKEISILNKNNMKQIYFKDFTNKYIYSSQLIGKITHPYSKQIAYILASIERGATGEPHRVVLDLFSLNQNIEISRFQVRNVKSNDSLNLREKAFSRSKIIATIPFDANTLFLVDSKKRKKEKSTWINIKYNNYQGWVNAYYIEPLSN